MNFLNFRRKFCGFIGQFLRDLKKIMWGKILEKSWGNLLGLIEKENCWGKSKNVWRNLNSRIIFEILKKKWLYNEKQIFWWIS